METFTENDQKILKHFKRTPAYEEAAIEAETAKHAERADAIRQISELRAAAGVEAPKLEKTRASALEKNQKAFASLNQSQDVLNRANVAMYNYSTRLTSRTTELESQLLDSSDPQIEKKIQELYAEIERIRHVESQTREVPTGLFRSGGIGAQVMKRYSNREALNDAMEQFDEAAKALVALKLSDQTDCEKSIAAIIDPLPEIGTVNSDFDTQNDKNPLPDPWFPAAVMC